MMDLNVRNIQSYNKEIKKNDESGVSKIYTPTEGNTEKYHEKLPYIVVVVDEFADMMQTVGKKVEDLIIRLSQRLELQVSILFWLPNDLQLMLSLD